jgi:type II secretory pathway component PulC
MIEDKAAKKTYFLKTGDEIKGMKVKAILKDRVILQYGEEEMELM